MPDRAESLSVLTTALEGWQRISSTQAVGILDRAAEFYIARFCPICVEAVQRFPDEFADPGNPPRTGPIRFRSFIAEELTGVADTVAAGRRLVFWSAAVGDPILCQRSVPTDHEAMQCWLRSWLVFHDRSTQQYRTWHQPVLWLARALREVMGDTSCHQMAHGSGSARPIPAWNRDRGQLMYCGQVIRTVVLRAHNVVKVLDAFEEDGWPDRIDDPLPRGTLHATLHSLNKRLRAVRFQADGGGNGIVWTPSGD